jgi:hypothetical protein
MPILRWLAYRRAFNRLVEQEAITLVEREGGAGYYTARELARRARDRGDLDTAKLWWQVSRRAAAMTGLQPGLAKIGRPESEW